MIKKAVFSYFPTTNDLSLEAKHWYNPRFHLYSWVMAVNMSRKWFEEVELITDSESAKLFVDTLKLPFTSVKTIFDDFKYDKELWALGKIKAYEVQDKPFIHVDNDCILFNPLYDNMLGSKILTQNPEDGAWFTSAYQDLADYFEENAEFLPLSWKKSNYAACMGVYGVNDMDFNKEYCKQVFEMIDNNPKFWSSITNKGSYCIIFEQHMLANVAEDMKIPITYLSNPFDYKELEKIGYTHIWGGKKEQMWYDKIKDMIKSYYPKEYKLINEIIPE